MIFIKKLLGNKVMSQLICFRNQRAFKRFISVIAMMLIGTVNFSLQARIISIQASNSPTQLTINSNAQSQISWSVVEEEKAADQASISSTGGTFFDITRKSVLGRNNISLNQTRTLVKGMNTTFVFSESLFIPQSVIRKAQDLGFSQLIYVRSFQDSPGGSSLSDSVVFSLSTSGLAGQLSINRVQMEFDDGRTSAIVSAESKMQAQALINYVGTGLIEYTWEIATPPSTQGHPMFVPLVSRRQYLMTGSQVTIQSPPLPSLQHGSFLLRLRIDNPNPQFDMPMLRYAVRGNTSIESDTRILPISVSSPPVNAKLTPETEFSWNPVTGANAYQVEIFDRPTRNSQTSYTEQAKPVTGVIIPAAETHLKIGKLSRAHLNHGSTYFWRVIAIAEDGQLIAISEFRSINF